MLILIADAFDSGLADKLARFGEVTRDVDRLPEADILLVRSKTKATAEYLKSAKKLKLILRGGVGTDNIDKAFCEDRGILVRNTPRSPAIAVAELAFALMLSVPNHLHEAHASMERGEWKKKELKRTELHGKTLGLVGIGNIAQAVAVRAAAFGMRVIAYDKYVESSGVAEMIKTLPEMLAQADYVSLHLPLTDETRGLIGKDALAAMKDGVVVINTGRGLTVDTPAMVAALESGKVRAYATDVWQSDPPPADDPLLKAPNVIKVPHIGASSVENLARIGDECVERIEDFLGGAK